MVVATFVGWFYQPQRTSTVTLLNLVLPIFYGILAYFTPNNDLGPWQACFAWLPTIAYALYVFNFRQDTPPADGVRNRRTSVIA